MKVIKLYSLHNSVTMQIFGVYETHVEAKIAREAAKRKIPDHRRYWQINELELEDVYGQEKED